MFHGDDQDLTSNMKLAVDFFNHLNMLYGTVTEFCTPQEVRLSLRFTRIHGITQTNTVPDYVCRPAVSCLFVVELQGN